MMDHAQFFLFRKFGIRLSNQAGISLDEQKTRELLCYLLIFRNRPHPRDALASMLWSDAPERQARGYFRRTLWQLQNGLAPLSHAQDGLLTVETDWILLNFHEPLWLDVQVFEQAADSAAELDGHSLSADRARLLEEAIRLYQGHLLESCYADWCVAERERLLQVYLTMLEQLMDFCEANGRCENGMRYGMEALRHDRARESTHARLMRLYALSGDRTGALRQFDRCVTALRNELGVAPIHATRALYEQIRADRLAAPGFSSPVPAAPGFSSPVPAAPAACSPTQRPLVELLDCMYQLQETLSNVQQQVIQEMRAVDRILPEPFHQPFDRPAL